MRRPIQHEIENKAVSAMPRWALALCAIMMALSLSIRQMGLDISSPINRIMTAHAVRIEMSANNPTNPNGEIKEIIQILKSTEKRIQKLERWAHKPNGDDIPD